MGYSETSKDYRIYFPGFKKIDTIREVTSDEDSSYKKSRKRLVEVLVETELPRIHDTTMNEEIPKEYKEIEEPIDSPQEKNPHKRKPDWVQEAIQGVERYEDP